MNIIIEIPAEANKILSKFWKSNGYDNRKNWVLNLFKKMKI